MSFGRTYERTHGRKEGTVTFHCTEEERHKKDNKGYITCISLKTGVISPVNARALELVGPKIATLGCPSLMRLSSSHAASPLSPCIEDSPVS